MLNPAPYQAWIVLFRRMKLASFLVALLGLGLWLMDRSPFGIVSLMASELIAAWMLVVGMVQQRRYQAYLDKLRSQESGDSTSVAAESALPAMSSDEKEAIRLSVLRGYERFFMRAAVICIGIAVIGFGIGLQCVGTARWIITSGVGIGGLWLAWMSYVIGKRIRTGPKLQQS